MITELGTTYKSLCVGVLFQEFIIQSPDIPLNSDVNNVHT